MKTLHALGLVTVLTVASHSAFALQDVSSVNDFDNLIKNNKYVVVDFYADWCGPCKAMKSTLGQIESQYSDVVFRAVNIDRLSSLANRFSVRSIPVVILFKDGQVFSRWVGSKPASYVKAEVNKLIA